MAQRQEQFQQEAQQGMQKAQEDSMTPIYQKLNTAIQTVGDAEGVVYIFDLARTSIPYVGSQSTDLTAKVKAQLGIK
jgi:outer membrane protein